MDKIDIELFNYHWKKNPKAGLYLAVKLIFDKVNELVDAENKIQKLENER